MAAKFLGVVHCFFCLRSAAIETPSSANAQVNLGSKSSTALVHFLVASSQSVLPFPDILQHFGYSLPSKCPCCEHVDTLHHFFFECCFAESVWRFFFQLFHCSLEECADLQQLLSYCWDSSRPEFLQLLPIYVIWLDASSQKLIFSLLVDLLPNGLRCQALEN